MRKSSKIGRRLGIVLLGIILLAIVVRIILNIVFGIQLRNTVRQLKAQGRHLTLDQIRPAPVQDSENAAILLNQVFTLMTIGEGGKPYIPNQDGGNNNKVVSKIESVKSFSDISKWTPEERLDIPGLVYSQDMGRIYGLIEEASRRPRCNFDLKYEKGPAMLLPHFAKMRSVERLLAVKAGLEAQSGNLAGALDTLNTGLRISSLLKDEPLLISKLVMVACQGIMIDCLQGVTKYRNIPRGRANLTISELSKYTGANFLDGEMALFGGWILREINEGHAYSSVGKEMFPPDIFRPTVVFKAGTWFWTPVFKKDLAVYFIVLSKLEDGLKEPYYRLVRENGSLSNGWLEKQIPRYCILSRMLLPALEHVSTTAARNQAYIDVCKTGLALKVYKGKHGYYPDFLDKLKPEFLPEIPLDTFTGKSLIYHKTTNSVFVYSLGENLKDDGGRWGESSNKWDGGDIVWAE